MSIVIPEGGRPERRRRVQAAVGTKSRTKQSMAAACDINNIMKKYERTGVLEHIKSGAASYGDFSNVVEYHDALNKVQAAQAHFAALPAKIRDYCRNDPSELLALIDDPERIDEMIEIGLIEREETPPSQAESESGQEEPASEEAAEEG